ERGSAGGAIASTTTAPAGHDNYSSYANDSLGRLGTIGKLTNGTVVEDGALQGDEEKAEKTQAPPNVQANNGPMIVRTAELGVTTKDFDKGHSSVEEILKRHHGYVGEMNVNTPTGSARSLTATLRIPADGLEAVLADLKRLGRTEKESQTG